MRDTLPLYIDQEEWKRGRQGIKITSPSSSCNETNAPELRIKFDRGNRVPFVDWLYYIHMNIEWYDDWLLERLIDKFSQIYLNNIRKVPNSLFLIPYYQSHRTRLGMSLKLNTRPIIREPWPRAYTVRYKLPYTVAKQRELMQLGLTSANWWR